LTLTAPGFLERGEPLNKPAHNLLKTHRDRNYWSTTPWVNEAIQTAILQSTIVLVPQEGFRDHNGPVFPVGTDGLFNYLREKQTSTGLTVELAVEDAQYVEIALHSDIVRIATAIVSLLLAPLVVNLLGDYIRDRLGGRANKAEVHSSLIVEQTDGLHRTSISINYEGPAANFESSMKEAIEAIRTGKAQLGEPPTETAKQRH